MVTYIILTILIGISALFAYINYKYIKIPFVIGIFLLSTLVSLCVYFSKFWFFQPFTELKKVVQQTDISKFILEIMLGFLLFAGSLHTDWFSVKKYLKQIAMFAIGGVIISTALIAFMVYGLCNMMDIHLDFLYCLLFGALISPTDPIAVLSILTKAKVPKKIESIIVGESLFNDGIGVVIFIALLETLHSTNSKIDYIHFGLIFFQEAMGGILFGLAFGWLLHNLLKSIDEYETEVLLTIAFVMVGYSFCLFLQLSGPLAMVVMGLLVGNYKQNSAMGNQTQAYVHIFWKLIDMLLNAVLFILIALILIVIEFKVKYLLLGFASIFLVLLSRVILLYFPMILFPRFLELNKNESKIIIWGGLRGGLSIALVLSLPNNESKNILLTATYFCVLFSILVQGLTIGKLAKNLG